MLTKYLLSLINNKYEQNLPHNHPLFMALWMCSAPYNLGILFRTIEMLPIPFKALLCETFPDPSVTKINVFIKFS